MKSALIVTPPARLVVYKPPLFAILCLVIWAASLVVACSSHSLSDSIAAAADIVAP